MTPGAAEIENAMVGIRDISFLVPRAHAIGVRFVRVREDKTVSDLMELIRREVSESFELYRSHKRGDASEQRLARYSDDSRALLRGDEAVTEQYFAPEARLSPSEGLGQALPQVVGESDAIHVLVKILAGDAADESDQLLARPQAPADPADPSWIIKLLVFAYKVLLVAFFFTAVAFALEYVTTGHVKSWRAQSALFVFGILFFLAVVLARTVPAMGVYDPLCDVGAVSVVFGVVHFIGDVIKESEA